MEKEKRLFKYRGAVLKHNVVVAENWFGKTMAASEKQAKSNLAYQFKKAMGYVSTVPITLAGKVEAVTSISA